MARVLMIDDDKMICDLLSRIAGAMGHQVASAGMLGDGLRKAHEMPFDVVFLDVNLPDGNGLEVLPSIRSTASSPEVIIVTGVGDPDGAELAIKNGAWDYVQKPFSKKDVMLQLARVLQYREEKRVAKPPVALKRGGIVGESARIRACLDLVAQAAASEASVLITGETGTGKELFARAIHDNGARARGCFVVVDCAALPQTLVESVLFGHVKGAFTGADKAQDGLVLQANKGTLFLDEVGELPFAVQRAFLRVLQEHCFRPVGSEQEVESDFRLVAATNRDLDQMVHLGQFRQDLLFRLRSLRVELPAMRERPEDVKGLVMHHVARLCERDGIATKGFSPEFLEALVAYGWPGNVRELINTLETALANAHRDATLFPMHLPSHLRIKLARASVNKGPEAKERLSVHDRAFPPFRDFRQAGIAELERRYLSDLMSLTNGDMKEAGRISDLSRSRLYGLLNANNISKTG